MQRNDLAEKKRVLIDGEEIPGLVYLGAIPLEKGQLEVPEYDRVRRIQNGISTVPARRSGWISQGADQECPLLP